MLNGKEKNGYMQFHSGSDSGSVESEKRKEKYRTREREREGGKEQKGMR